MPPGLTFDATTRTLSGTPTVSAPRNYNYKVRDAGGGLARHLYYVQTNAALSFGTEMVANQTYTVGQSITTLDLPQATGGTGDLTCTLAPLPNGLNFIFTPAGTRFGQPTAEVRRLTAQPRAGTEGTTTLTYTVTDSASPPVSTTQTFSVTVTAAALAFAETIEAQAYTKDTEITDLTLLVATGGTAPYTYTLPDLPDGLNFNANTRILSGTPDTAGTSTLTYTVTDANGASATLSFTVTIALNSPATGVPTISGSATEDETLTAVTTDIMDADGVGTFSYQWQAGGSAIYRGDGTNLHPDASAGRSDDHRDGQLYRWRWE